MLSVNSNNSAIQSVAEYRAFYARLVVGVGGSSNKRLLAAFSAVGRERFVGSGPWLVHAGDAYIQTVSDDPRLLYQDVLIGLAPERGINNGQPSLHARCIAACAPRAGETVLHIGAGTGYYTAVLAEMVGHSGAVVAYELEADLAERARSNLAQSVNVTVVAGNAATAVLPSSDVIYVNAGATHPLASWLDALSIGGRLVFPLTTESGSGFMLMVCRWRERQYTAACLSMVRFIPCIGARDSGCSRALAAALASKPPQQVRSLHRGIPPDATTWCAADGWWLSTADPVV